MDWLDARQAILDAQRRHDDAGEPPRILLINGSSRTEHTCPGEMSSFANMSGAAVIAQIAACVRLLTRILRRIALT